MKKPLLLVLLFISFFLTTSACSNGHCQMLESCTAATDCAPGLYCGNCPILRKNKPFCIRGQNNNIPTAIVNGLPFNKYTWLVTHNAFSIVDAPLLSGPQRITFYNQEDSVTNQLRNGVRGLMLDMYDFENDIWLCHSLRGQCYNITAFEASEGIAYQWRYIIENEPGDPGFQKGSCSNRKESKPLTSKAASLFLQNYFPTLPVQAEACKENSAPLMNMVATCYKAAGNTMPNFLAVNFYMRSDGGGVFDALDRMNGQTLCGCVSITACQAGAPLGTCRNNEIRNFTSPANPRGSFSGNVQLTASASRINLTSLLTARGIIDYILRCILMLSMA
ncbi:hypothetical protein M8C21_028409 [Ambrosia artemisiifolia]|uniref:PI-PLC X domain-containing protein n=1 Tax=Ambrosia artemisiifolia TaxID=4212 RepID=A0AAD5G8D3_AMBAR|nr:hypothetical protein M8C21_028409 [Ambrosia artemisiifolia]